MIVIRDCDYAGKSVILLFHLQILVPPPLNRGLARRQHSPLRCAHLHCTALRSVQRGASVGDCHPFGWRARRALDPRQHLPRRAVPGSTPGLSSCDCRPALRGRRARTPFGQSGSLCGLRLVPSKWRCRVPPLDRACRA